MLTFELRYLQMIGECERQGTSFGVVTLTRGQEVQRPGEAERFEPIGTHVQIERIERPQPGLVRVWCRGVEKFRIEATQQRSDRLWLAQVQPLLPPEPTIQVPEDLQRLSTQMHEALTQLSVQPSEVPHWNETWRLQDCGWLSNRYGELLPLPLAMKYWLFALQEPLMRMELIGDFVAPISPDDPTGKPPANS